MDFSNQSFESTLATICMDASRHNPVLVEGRKDEDCLKKFFSDKANFIYTGSKNNVEKVIKRLFRFKTNIIGICDRDYDSVRVNEHIFYYDSNNLEMMLIKDDEIFDDATFESLNISPSSLISKKNQTLVTLLPISILRMVSFESKIKLTLDEIIPADDLLIAQTKEENIRCIKTSILNKVTDLSVEQRSNFICSYATKCEQTYDFYNITQGHDFVKIFRKIITNLSERRFYSMFIESFSDKLFKKTILFSSIKSYERMESLSLLKS